MPTSDLPSKPDWSKIGRRSRRKGKSFEREIAGLLRAARPDQKWQTVRNSGRTDLPGDVYCIGREDSCCLIECKHREECSIKDMLLGSFKFRKMIREICEEWVRSKRSQLIVIVKNAMGVWVADPWPRDHGSRIIAFRFEDYFRIGGGIVDNADGWTWRRVEKWHDRRLAETG